MKRLKAEANNMGWIAVDLDDTLAYTLPGKYDPSEIGPPIKPMLHRVQRWLREGREVRLFTARVAPNGTTKRQADIDAFMASWPAWSMKHLGQVLVVTCIKDPSCIELWDDKARQVRPGTGEVVDPYCVD